MFVVLILFTLLFLLFFALYCYSKRKFKYWKNKNVPYLEPFPVVGNYGPYIFQREHMGGVAQRICSAFPKAGLVGSFYGTEPALLIQDPNLIKLILTKDFQYFHSREVMDHADMEVMGRGVFFSCGERWKMARQHLMPFFTSAKMKNMFYLIQKYACQFENLLDYEFGISNQVEITSISARFTMDCIGSCGFGIETKTMGEDVNNPYRIVGPRIFGNSIGRGFKKVARSIWPSIFYGIGCKSYPSEISNFFHSLLIGVFEQRNYQPTSRNDFIDLMLALKLNNSNSSLQTKKGLNLKVDDDFLVAQSMTLFSAGFETSSSVLCFTLFEMAKNKDVQIKASAEVDEYLRRNNGKLDFNCTTELPYLASCVHESMRLYPALGVLTREAVEDYTFPSGLKIDRGVHVHIPLYHLHRHPELFPNPEKYRPERFLNEKNSIKPYTYLPFGEGPRICMGIKFSEMQVMSGLITVLKKYSVELADDMPVRVEIESRTPNTQPKGGIRLKLTSRQVFEQRLFARGDN